MENKVELEKLLNSNEKYSSDYTSKLLEDKEGCKKFVQDLDTYINEHKPNSKIFLDEDCVLPLVNKTNLSRALEEFRIHSRTSILSEKKRLLYIIREEELLTTINNLQGKLEEYDKYVSENSKEDVVRKYSNQQLQEFAIIRSQSLPMYLVELETLSSATKDNESNYRDSTDSAYMYASGIKEFLETELNGK